MKAKPVELDSIRVLPATSEHWPGIEEFFTGSACWCQYWRLSSSAYGRISKDQLPRFHPERKNAMRRLLDQPTPPGVVAYLEDQVIGWCGFGPRSEMERLVRSRTIPAIDHLPVWSIVCFLVRPGYRRQGVSSALLRGAIECARKYKAPALEAYPVDSAGKRIDVVFAYVGITAMFEKEGFRRVVETSARSASLPRWLMRLDLRPR